MKPKLLIVLAALAAGAGLCIRPVMAEMEPTVIVQYTLEQAQVAAEAQTKLDQTKPLTLDDAIQLALTRSDQIRANTLAGAAAMRQAMAAGQLPDPILTLQVNNLPINGANDFAIGAEAITRRTIGISQTWLSEAKRDASKAVQAGRAGQAKAVADLVASDVATGTAKAWFEAYFLQQTLGQYEALRQELQVQAESLEALYQGNVAAQADVFSARQSLSMLELKTSRLRGKLASAKATLARWLTGGQQLTVALANPPDITNLGKGAELALQNPQHLPAITQLAAAGEVAQANLQLRTEQTKADWTSQLQFSKRGDRYSDTVSVMFSRPLLTRLENNQLQLQAAAQAELERVEVMQRDAVLAQTNRLTTLKLNWEEGVKRMRVLQDELIPIAKQRIEAAMAAYQGATGGLPAVLLARKSELEMQIEYLDVSLEVAQWWAELEYAMPARESK